MIRPRLLDDRPTDRLDGPGPAEPARRRLEDAELGRPLLGESRLVAEVVGPRGDGQDDHRPQGERRDDDRQHLAEPRDRDERQSRRAEERDRERDDERARDECRAAREEQRGGVQRRAQQDDRVLAARRERDHVRERERGDDDERAGRGEEVDRRFAGEGAGERRDGAAGRPDRPSWADSGHGGTDTGTRAHR